MIEATRIRGISMPQPPPPVYVQITMSEEEAQTLKWITVLNETIPNALRNWGGAGAAKAGDLSHSLLGQLEKALFSAGVKLL